MTVNAGKSDHRWVFRQQIFGYTEGYKTKLASNNEVLQKMETKITLLLSYQKDTADMSRVYNEDSRLRKSDTQRTFNGWMLDENSAYPT